MDFSLVFSTENGNDVWDVLVVKLHKGKEEIEIRLIVVIVLCRRATIHN